jgi:hypothetical protein
MADEDDKLMVVFGPANVGPGDDKALDVLDKYYRRFPSFREFLIYVGKLEEALIWCSGSKDFGPGGIAEEGWNTVCRPLLKDMT